jgi:hypothetical protein
MGILDIFGQQGDIKIGDMLRGLDGVSERQKMAKGPMDGLESLVGSIENWVTTGAEPSGGGIGEALAPPKAPADGAKGGASKPPVENWKKAFPGLPTPTDKSETFGWLDKVLSPIEKLGAGAERGIEALLSPVSGVFDVLTEPRMKLEKMKLDAAERMGGLEARTGLQQTALEEIGKAERDLVTQAHEAELQRQAAIDKEELEKLKQKAPAKTLDEMLSRGLIDNATYKSLKRSGQKATWQDLFAIAHRKREAGDDSMWNALVEYRKAGRMSLDYNIDEELKKLGSEPIENPEGDFYFVDRSVPGETTFTRKPGTPPDARVKGPFERRK